MSLSHFFSITQTWRIAISWLDTPGRVLSSTWYHRWLQLVTPMRQNAQKRSRKFCRSKEGKNSETHPIQPEKGETGCVLGAGGSASGWERMKTGGKAQCLNHIAIQHMKKENRQKSRVSAGFLAGAEGLVSPAGSVGPGRSPPGCRPPRHAPQAGLRAHLAAKSYRTLTKKSGTAEAIPDFFGRGRRT